VNWQYHIVTACVFVFIGYALRRIAELWRLRKLCKRTDEDRARMKRKVKAELERRKQDPEGGDDDFEM
jgi:hypothetical protein